MATANQAYSNRTPRRRRRPGWSQALGLRVEQIQPINPKPVRALEDMAGAVKLSRAQGPDKDKRKGRIRATVKVKVKMGVAASRTSRAKQLLVKPPLQVADAANATVLKV